MGTIRVGTASWTDKSLIDSKRFYPAGCTSAEDRLRFYASQFPIVEVDSSYYALPSARNASLWVERTPPGFTFNVKAFRALTRHQTPRRALPQDLLAQLPDSRQPNVYDKDLPDTVREALWSRFLSAVAPLRAAGKLGALHFQFPPWFTARRDNYAYLDTVRERLDGYTVAVEFRHASWFDASQRDATLQFERERGFVNVIVDEPQGSRQSIPAVWATTSPELAIVRLHGRNTATWSAKGLAASSERFNYDYATQELTGFVAPIRELAAEVATVHVIFNNNYEDQGVRNGRELTALLT